MRRLFGAVLMVVGVLVPTVGIWWLLATGYMDAHPFFRGRAFGGMILWGLICAFIGFVLLFARDRRAPDDDSAGR
jgi:hypothetical protein